MLLERQGFGEKVEECVRRGVAARKVGVLRTGGERDDPVRVDDGAEADSQTQKQVVEDGEKFTSANGTLSSSTPALRITESVITISATQSVQVVTLDLGFSIDQVAQDLFAGL